MLPRKFRLKRMKDFDILFKEGRFAGGDLVTVKSWKIDPSKYERRGFAADDLLIGFVVSKKIHKSAVKRNRLKRQMREVVRLLLQDNKLSSGYLVAIMAKKEMLDASYEEMYKSIIEVLTKARVMKK